MEEQVETMSPEEQFRAISELKSRVEENFLALGDLLSAIQRKKTYKIRGFKSFRDFIEQEFNMEGTFASKLISVFDLYIRDLDVDEHSLKTIGFDKLNMLRPMVKNATFEESDEWMTKAQSLKPQELRQEIKEAREKKKTKTMKDVYIEQFKEKMVEFFNCSQKELNFKLALYFQDLDLDEVRTRIREQQRKFEEQLTEEAPQE